jgi:hypothetical protein
MYNTDPAEHHVTALCHFISLSVSPQSTEKQDKFFLQTQVLALIREVKFTHILMLNVGSFCCKLPLYTLM